MTNFVHAFSGRDFTFFYTSKSPFSNHCPVQFVMEGDTRGQPLKMRNFNCTEQYYLQAKALTFNDLETAQLIAQSNSPTQMKSLSQKWEGSFNGEWEEVKMQIMYKANHAKFLQNPSLRMYLFTTLGSSLVECSPVDRFWGIGLSLRSPLILDGEAKWKGRNQMGVILEEVRNSLAKGRNLEEKLNLLKH